MNKGSVFLIGVGVLGFVLTKLARYTQGSMVHISLPSFMSYGSIVLVVLGLLFAFSGKE